MEIVVEGVGEEYFTPDEIIFNINFNYKNDNYAYTLEKGVLSVKTFIDEIIIKNGFNQTDLKTRSFVVRENQVYNESTRKYEKAGYIFTQSATLKFDYNKELLAKLIDEISRLEVTPLCQINFGVKNIKECKRTVIKKAYNEAYLEALAIAEAAGKTLKQCLKIDFRPFSTNFQSNSVYENNRMFEEMACGAAPQENILNTFTPEDILVTNTLYCLFIAE